MSLQVRRAEPAELRAVLDAMTTSFLERIDLDKGVPMMEGLWDFGRIWVAEDGGRIVGTYRTFPSEVTVPGQRQVAAGGVSGVTVMPSHRRRGVLRRFVEAEHAAMLERGEPVALLYASEWPIYGRFGYGMATRQATWELDARATDFHRPITGRIELAPADRASRDAIRDVFEAWRHRQVGEIQRRETDWDFELALRPDPWGEDWKGFLALHRDDSGTIDGYARYRADGKWERRQPRGTLNVDEMHGLTDDATASLWRFLAETDWVATVVAERRSPSDALPWLCTNGRAAHIREQGDALWACLLDVPAAMEGRSYAGEGSVVVEVVGPGPEDRQRLRLEASLDGARCRPSRRAADVTVPLAALGAAYLGGSRLEDAAIAHGGVDEHRAGAARRLDELLRTAVEPWCSSFF